MANENKPGPVNGDHRRPAIFEEMLARELHILKGIEETRPYTGADCIKEKHDCDSSYVAKVVADAHNAKLSGLAFSGGGIRSATFNLGVLQSLARLRLLKKFDYLSTVSGGGYIGSWLSAWINRENSELSSCGQSLEGEETQTGAGDSEQKSGIDIVNEELAASASNDQAEQLRGAMQPDPPAIWHLREYSNYLTPKRGLLSTDGWAIGTAYIRNLLLTLSVLLCAVITLVLFSQAIASGFYQLAHWTPEKQSLFTLPYYPFITLMYGASFFLGIELSPRRARNANNSVLALIAVVLTLLSSIAGALWLWSLTGDVQLQETIGLLDIGRAVLGLIVGTTAAGFIGRWFGNRELFGDALPEDEGRDQHLPLLILASIITLFALTGMWWGIESWMVDYRAAHSNEPAQEWFFVVWGAPLIVLSYSLATVLYGGLVGSAQSEIEREWLARFFGALLKITVLFTLLMLLVIYSYKLVGLLSVGGETGDPDSYKLTIASIWAALSGLGAYLARGGTSIQNNIARWSKSLFLALAPWVFIFGLFIFTIWGVQSLVDSTVIEYIYKHEGMSFHDEVADIRAMAEKASDPDRVSLLMMNDYWMLASVMGLLSLILTLVWSRLVGVNDFSLHSLYGNRLIRAYLGASNLKREAHPFTGFDQDDNSVAMADLVPTDKNNKAPYPIINAAINLVSSRRLAWQKRKAASFTFTPAFCGYEFCEENGNPLPGSNRRTGGYVSSDAYGGGEGRGVSLGKAMTISGAAASPNMGYHSSPGLTFLMTTFNVRLGWWLPNTAIKNTRLQRLNGPRMGILYLITEALGLTGTDRNYVYLSDGGHFENLGIYELVRRRCQFIIACDAEADPALSFSGLGNAIEKCRTDLGVPINIDVSQIKKNTDNNRSSWHCAVGCIRYSDADSGQPDGTLLYLKASLTGDEPQDVATYAMSHSRFPHESTADQWFDESQFESYRVLGEHSTRLVLENAVNFSRHQPGRENFMERLFLELRRQWYPHCEPEHVQSMDHDTRLEELVEILRTDTDLEFLDWQLYPSLQQAEKCFNTGHTGKKKSEHHGRSNYPENIREFRAGFYFCKQLIQFMQQVFHNRKLDTDNAAPSNRGWMNLFRRWTLSRMFRFTWVITAGTYSARFQSFCEYHLSLGSGTPHYGDEIKIQARITGSKENPSVTFRVTGKKSGHDKKANDWMDITRDAGMHHHECMVIEEFIKAYVYSENVETVRDTMEFYIYPLQLMVDNQCIPEPSVESNDRAAAKQPQPGHGDSVIPVNAGLAIVGPHPGDPHHDKRALIYFRIRAAMRNMDLARKAFLEISPYLSTSCNIALDHKLPDLQPAKHQDSAHKRAYREVHDLDRQDMMRCRWFSRLPYDRSVNNHNGSTRSDAEPARQGEQDRD